MVVTAEVAFTVPVVDIGPYVTGGCLADRRSVAQQMDRACTDVGFVQILGHGIPVGSVASMVAAMDRFFDLPQPQKNRYRAEVANRGYTPPHREALSLSLGITPYGDRRDFFEAFNVGVEAQTFPALGLSEDDYGLNLWPAVPGFEAAVDDGPVTIKEHLAAKLRGSGGGQPNLVAGGEADRVRTAR